MNIKDITPPILLSELNRVDSKVIADIESIIAKMEFPIITDVNDDEIVITFYSKEERASFVYNLDSDIHNLVFSSDREIYNLTFDKFAAMLDSD